MAQATKSEYYQALKAQGVTFEKHYRDYTRDELRELWVAAGGETWGEEPEQSQFVQPKVDDEPDVREQIAHLSRVVAGLAELVTAESRRDEVAAAPIAAAGEMVGAPATAAPAQATAPKESHTAKPFAHDLDPNEHAGVTQNTHQGSDILEIDEHGNEWYQKEVTKPAFPKPRGRRVLRYMDPGVKPETIKVGDYVEGFEIAGDMSSARPAEIKITLPSYQTGIYKAPNMPFKIHTYNGVRGFDLEDVQKYYGGADLVPDTIKRCYVSTDLCYDIQSTIRTIENEYRERVLKQGRL